jgi:hypothetical protein
VLLVWKRSSEACGYGAGMDASTAPANSQNSLWSRPHTVATALTTLGRVDLHPRGATGAGALAYSLSGRRAVLESGGSRPPGFFGRYRNVKLHPVRVIESPEVTHQRCRILS